MQQAVLPRVPAINYLCKPKTDLVEPPYPWAGALGSFFGHSPSIWDGLGDQLFHDLFGEPDTDKAQDTLVSDENACVYMRYPSTFVAPERDLMLAGRDPVLVAAHLKKISNLAQKWDFARVRLLVTVRRQDTFLASAYSQDSDRWPKASQSHFEEYIHALLDPASEYYVNGVSLDYEQLWGSVEQVVGNENLLMLPYELMKRNLKAFLEQWLEFLQVSQREKVIQGILAEAGAEKRNVGSVTEGQWRIKKHTTRNAKVVIRLRPGRLFRAIGIPTNIPLRWPQMDRGTSIHITPALRRRILGSYEKSNRVLDKRLGAGLGRYGYYP